MQIDGLVLESKYPEYQWCIKGPIRKVWKDGFPVDEPKLLVLQFDRYLCEVDEMVQNQEWTPEDKEYVARIMERDLVDPRFRDAWQHQAPKIHPPWPTYDETHHNQVPVIAKATGQVAEALAYEERGRPDGPRESVVKKLRALLAEPRDNGSAAPEPAEAEDLLSV